MDIEWNICLWVTLREPAVAEQQVLHRSHPNGHAWTGAQVTLFLLRIQSFWAIDGPKLGVVVPAKPSHRAGDAGGQVGLFGQDRRHPQTAPAGVVLWPKDPRSAGLCNIGTTAMIQCSNLVCSREALCTSRVGSSSPLPSEQPPHSGVPPERALLIKEIQKAAAVSMSEPHSCPKIHRNAFQCLREMT